MLQRNSPKSTRQFTPRDWGAVLKLRVGIPAHQFFFVLKPAGRQLFRMAEDVYAVVWEMQQIADGYPSDTARVARVFWAKNWQAARLIGYHHPKIDRARMNAGSGNPPLHHQLSHSKSCPSCHPVSNSFSSPPRQRFLEGICNNVVRSSDDREHRERRPRKGSIMFAAQPSGRHDDDD